MYVIDLRNLLYRAFYHSLTIWPLSPGSSGKGLGGIVGGTRFESQWGLEKKRKILTYKKNYSLIT